MPILQGADLDARTFRDAHNALSGGQRNGADALTPTLDFAVLFSSLVDDGIFDNRIEALVESNLDKISRGKHPVNPKASGQELAARMSAKAGVTVSASEVRAWLRAVEPESVTTQGEIRLEHLITVPWEAEY